ncbi:MAG: YaiO family outer membrane beta-barrel protein [Gemmatimonadaceae bacterium]
MRRTSVAGDYGYVSFGGDIDAWQLASLSVSRRTERGSLIGRVNWANRFATSGTQVEMDAYPRLTSRTYAYLNGGYSDASIFPKWRLGAELYANLPRAWEASIGFRQLRFGGSPVTLYTGTIARYVGNYWISARPFVHFKDTGTSASLGLTARRYFEDADRYVGATVSYGSSPSDRITPDALERTNSFSAGIHGSAGLSERLLGTWAIGRDREELDAERIRNSLSVTAGLRFFF